jgi:cytochrome c
MRAYQGRLFPQTQEKILRLDVRPIAEEDESNAFPRHGTRLMLRTTFVLTCITLLIVFSASSSVSQDADAGQLEFNNACRTCHSLKEGDNRLGPNLHKVLGRKAGSLPNYGYSSAMKSADFVWDKAKLDGFIANPDAVVVGNNMKPYGGLASADDRAKVINFLEKQQ